MSDHEDDDYLDYLAEYESGFLSMSPPEVIDTWEALRRMAIEEDAVCKEVPMNNRRRRTAKKVRKAGGVRKAGRR